MGRTLRIVVSMPAEFAEFIADAPTGLAVGLLGELLTTSAAWRIGPPWAGEDGRAVAVVMLVSDPAAALLLHGAPDEQERTLRRVAAVRGWLLIRAAPAADPWPAVALHGVPVADMRAAEASADEWAGACRVVDDPSARFGLARVLN